MILGAIVDNLNANKASKRPVFTYCREDQQKSMRPDFVIKAERSQDTAPKPVFVLEAKKIDENKPLKDHLPQLFDYLRRLCLEHRYSHLFGVLTNYKSWIFVKFDLTAEVIAVRDRQVRHDEVAARFEVSPEVKIFEDLQQLQTNNLAKVIEIISLCCTLLTSGQPQ